MSDLLPCPFCGESVGVFQFGAGPTDHWMAHCRMEDGGCGALSAAAGSIDGAIAAWNRRAANAPADPALLALAVAEIHDLLETERFQVERVFRAHSVPDTGQALRPWWNSQTALDKAIAALLAPDGAASEGVTDG
ncbi:MAG: Lar family restriction alleviation protein [Ardenticatenia bacterium]|nr:Lar family restriction alleviation protein [Ardenticatenia bacterium]